MARFGDTQFVRGYGKPRDMDGAFVGDFEAFDEGMYGDCPEPASPDGAGQEVIIIPNKSAAGASPLAWLLGGLVLAKIFL